MPSIIIDIPDDADQSEALNTLDDITNRYSKYRTYYGAVKYTKATPDGLATIIWVWEDV